MSEPKRFQSATVAAALKAFRSKSRRFLVADEVGLGKTIVAQQIIKKMIKEKHGPLIVFYVCNNLSIASQNRRKILEILPKCDRLAAQCPVDRLTLIPVSDQPSHAGLHLYTLTPETSLPVRRHRRRDGRQEERALIYCMVKQHWPDLLRGSRRKMFQRGAKKYWQWVVNSQRKNIRGKGSLMRAFYASVRKELQIADGQHALPHLLTMAADQLNLIAHLRNALAACAIESLNPDLIIFDEFQNFRDLLYTKEDDVAERVIKRLRGEDSSIKTPLLMLSATPYELYTRNNDITDDGLSHHEQFYDLVEFLYGGNSFAKNKRKECVDLFSEFQTLIRKRDIDIPSTKDIKFRIQDILRPIMSRTERASHDDGLIEHSISKIPAPIKPDDMRIFKHFAQSIRDTHAGATVSYWSSIPLPAQTMGERYKAWKEMAKSTVAKDFPQFSKDMRNVFKLIDTIPHPKIRGLLDLMNLDNLLLPWTKPSLPWWPLKGQWNTAGSFPGKMLVFSRFRAVPQAIASIISFAAECRLLSGKNVSYEDLFTRRLLQAGPERHALLGYFHPSPWLITSSDPLMAKDQTPSGIRRSIRSQLRLALNKLGVIVKPFGGYHRPMHQIIARIENKAELWRNAQSAWEKAHYETGNGTEDKGLGKLIKDWSESASEDISEISVRELFSLVEYALASPGVVLGRALKRHWSQAINEGLAQTVNASWHGLRNYLDNPLFAAQLGSSEKKYPAALMKSVEAGNLEAVLDEQIWLLRTLYNLEGEELAQELLDSFRLRSGIFFFHELKGEWKDTFSLRCHVALPFTEVRAITVKGMEQTEKQLRTDEIRRAFNTPFWPYILATTSVGQEGLDFHAWCSSLVHWDLSHNPVDLEQREGRIQRFAGHSLRRQIASKIGPEVWSHSLNGESPWTKLAQLAEEKLSDHSGLCPWWVCPGAEINRYVFEVPSSEQQYWLEVMKEQRMLYRLVLGQPDQEDLLHILSSALISKKDLHSLTLELSAFFANK
jgi:hypothetical protein